MDDDDIQRLDNERAQYLGGDDTLYELMQHGVGYVLARRNLGGGILVEGSLREGSLMGGYLTGDAVTTNTSLFALF